MILNCIYDLKEHFLGWGNLYMVILGGLAVGISIFFGILSWRLWKKDYEKEIKIEELSKHTVLLKNLYTQLLLCDRPNIFIPSRPVSMSSVDGKKIPVLSLLFKNNGKRTANTLSIYMFLILNDFSEVYSQFIPNTNISPLEEKRFGFMDIALEPGKEFNFYFVTKVKYYDELMKINYSEVKFFQHNHSKQYMFERTGMDAPLIQRINLFLSKQTNPTNFDLL